MLDVVIPGLRVLLMMTVLTGGLYPLAVTALAQWLMPERANGSLVQSEGRSLGSTLIGQPFSDPKYFWGRPSATAPLPYDGMASSGSNLSATNPALIEAATARIEALRKADPDNAEPIPVDLVSASASGLDPHISPAAARYQLQRVARARGIDSSEVAAMVARFTSERTLGILGEPHVNVLLLNLALDRRE